jgi:hypothetical protein
LQRREAAERERVPNRANRREKLIDRRPAYAATGGNRLHGDVARTLLDNKGFRCVEYAFDALAAAVLDGRLGHGGIVEPRVPKGLF